MKKNYTTLVIIIPFSILLRLTCLFVYVVHLKCAYSMLREFVCRVLCYRVDAIYVVV